MLRNEGRYVSGYDLVAMKNVARVDNRMRLPKMPTTWRTAPMHCGSAPSGTSSSQLDLPRLRSLHGNALIVDGRHTTSAIMAHHGFWSHRAAGRFAERSNGN